MSDLLKHSKKVLSATLTVSTIVWSVGLFALMPAQVGAAAGDLIKTAGDPAVYLVDADGVTIHPFPHANVYTSWGFPADFSSTFTTDLSGFSVGNDVEFRDGALIRALETPAVFVVSGEKLRPVLSAEVFETLGYNYDNITWLPQSFLDKYGASGEMVSSTTTHPNGTLIKYASSSTVYLLQEGAKRAFATSDVIAVNGYANISVITIPSSETYADGSGIVVKESSATVPDGVGSAPADTTPPTENQPVGSGLTVALASDTPAASTILDDSSFDTTSGGGQAFVPMVKLALSAGSDGAVTVTNLKFKRSGISSDADIASIYLYDGDNLGDNLLEESTSFSSGVVSFNDPTGIVTVPAGGTKYLMLRADMSGTVDSGKTLSFNLNSASDVTTNGASVSGSFPITGNTHSIAQADDFGYVTIANVSPTAASTVNPGTVDHELWRFSLVASDQDMEVRYLKLSMTGSANNSDVANFSLEVAGEVLGTVDAMNANDEVVFDLSSNPYEIEKGKTKNVSLYGDIVGGSNRTIHLQLQEMYHANMFDSEYNVLTKINRADSWSVIESNSAITNTTINAGSLTISKSTDSPTGNIAAGATSIVYARFDFKATGEDVRINNLTVSTSTAIDEGKVYFDGSQVGSTADLNTSNQYSFGTTLVIPSGETKVIEIRADVEDQNGADLAADTTVQISLTAGSSNARALSSSTSISTGGVSANTLTVKAGTLTTTENTASIDATSSSPSGVKGDANVLIGSFIVKAGSGEGVTITQITLQDDVVTTAGSSLADTFQNMRLESGGLADMNGNYAAGTAIGDTKGTLTDTENTTYNFNPSPNIKLDASQQMTVNVYADVLNSSSSTQLDTVNGDTDGIVYPSTVTATGNDTSADASDSNGTGSGLQNVYLATSGSLTVENVAASNQARARIVTAGSTDVELYKFQMTALTEDVDVTRFIISDAILSTSLGATHVSGKSTSTFYNFELWDGGTRIAGPTSITSSSSPTVGGYIDFTLQASTPYRVDSGAQKVITLKADATAWPNMSSGSTHTFSLQTNPLGDAGSTRAITARGAGSSTAVNGPTSVATGSKITVRRAYPLVERFALGDIDYDGTVDDATMDDLTSGQNTLARFKVSAVGGEVRLKKMVFEISWTDTTTSTLMKIDNFKVYRNGSPLSNSTTSGTGEFVIYDGLGTADTNRLSGGTDGDLQLTDPFIPTWFSAASATSTSTRAVLLFGADDDFDAVLDSGIGEEIISGGGSSTYEIRATVTNPHQGASTDADSITVTLLGDDGQTQPLSGNLAFMASTAAGASLGYRNGVVSLVSTIDSEVAGTVTGYNFLWSDYSEDTNQHTTSVATSTGMGWTHGYQVPSSSAATTFIPLDNWSLTK